MTRPLVSAARLGMSRARARSSSAAAAAVATAAWLARRPLLALLGTEYSGLDREMLLEAVSRPVNWRGSSGRYYALSPVALDRFSFAVNASGALQFLAGRQQEIGPRYESGEALLRRRIEFQFFADVGIDRQCAAARLDDVRCAVNHIAGAWHGES